MKSYGTEDSSPANVVRGQATMTTQLQKAIPAMHHIDEMFLWLAHAMVHTFDMQAAQWWAFQTTQAGQYAIQLRGMISKDTTVPQYVMANERIAAMVERLPDTSQGFMQMSVERLCVPYQATLFSRYGMHYCAWQSLRSSAFLLPGQQGQQDRPTPLVVTALLYARQPIPSQTLMSVNHILEQAIPTAGVHGLLLPTTDPIRPLSPQGTQQSSTGRSAPNPFILPAGQGMPIQGGQQQTSPVAQSLTSADAINPQGMTSGPRSLPPMIPPQPLQATPAVPQTPLSQGQGGQSAASARDDLVPRGDPSGRPQADTSTIPTDPQALMDSKNNKPPHLVAQPTYLDLLQLTPRQYDKPMAIEMAGMRTSKPVIADKQARRLHEALDGKSTLEEVRARINMDMQDLYRAVRFLLIQQRIQLFEPNGQLVDKEQFLKE
ncbi:MAG TPA: hypothetical protein VKR06_19125 [Ktedonosporobacter sp.]|nr:hypothetical protein [Ktedonosporobacter sp.]